MRNCTRNDIVVRTQSKLVGADDESMELGDPTMQLHETASASIDYVRIQQLV
jgi:hypothetical protein